MDKCVIIRKLNYWVIKHKMIINKHRKGTIFSCFIVFIDERPLKATVFKGFLSENTEGSISNNVESNPIFQRLLHQYFQRQCDESTYKTVLFLTKSAYSFV